MKRIPIIAIMLCYSSLGFGAESGEPGEWITLFNGKDTSGWIKAKAEQPNRPWSVTDGMLSNAGNVGMDLCTVEEFSNYELELQYKLPPSRGNSGVYLRGQIELQIDDSRGKKNLTKCNAGAIYDIAAPADNPQKPAGQWNHLRIRHRGYRISVWHNRVLIHDNTYVDEHTALTMMESVAGKRKGQPLDLSRGPIMLQGDRSEIWYRAIRIRRLPAIGQPETLVK